MAFPKLGRRPQIDGAKLVIFAPACVVCAFILLLVLVVLWMSLRIGLPGYDSPLTLQNYYTAFSDPFTFRVLSNTVLFLVATLAALIIFVIPLAVLMERTDLPGRRMFESIMGLNILIPTFLTAMCWVMLLNPRNGVINTMLMNLFGLVEAPFSVYNVPMMGLVQGLVLSPVAYFMVAAALRSIDPSLEEASRVSGANALQTVWRVTLPATLPAMAAALIYVAMIAFAIFEVPAIIGAPMQMFVLSTAIYRAVNPMFGLPEYGLAGAYGIVLLIVGLILSYFYQRTIKESHKYAVVTGKGYRPRLIQLGGWKWLAVAFVLCYSVLAFVLPFIVLVWASLLPYLQAPSPEALALVSISRYFHIGDFLKLGPVLNTVMLVLLVPTLSMLLSSLISWLIIKNPGRVTRVLDTLAFLPHCTPHILFAVALAYLSLILRAWLPIYGTMAIIVLVLVVSYVSFGTRSMNAAFIQLHKELEEAAQIAGGSVLNVILNVTLPLVRHAIFNGWIWVALLSLREVTMAITLRTGEANTVVTTQIWTYWNSGKVPEAATLGVLTIVVMGAVLALARAVGARVGQQ